MGKAWIVFSRVSCAVALAACGSSGGGPGAGGPVDNTHDNGCLDKTPVNSWQAVAPPPAAAAATQGAQGVTTWTGTRILLSFPTGTVSYTPPDLTSYDPCTDHWTDPIAGKNAGGFLLGATYISYWPSNAFRLDTTTMSWSSMSTQGGPQAQDIFDVFAAGDQLLVFGSLEPDTTTLRYVNLATGFRYDLAADAWSTTAPLAGYVEREPAVQAVVGGRLVVWGGSSRQGTLLNDGYVYDVAADRWSTMSGVGAPAPTDHVDTVSTGSTLIFLGERAIYDPALDTWRAMSASGAPFGPTVQLLAKVWTGDKLFTLVADASNKAGGSLYDPAADAWSNTATPPASLTNPTIGSTSAYASPDGQVLVVPPLFPTNGAATFDPVANQWSAVSQVGAPNDPPIFMLWTGARLFALGEVMTFTCSPQPCDPFPPQDSFSSGQVYRAP